LEGRLSFFGVGDSVRKWSGYVRNSPTRYSDQDGDSVLQALQEAQKNPVVRPVDPKQLRRSANLYKTRLRQGNEEFEAVVGVPVEEEEEAEPQPSTPGGPTHTEIQYRLLDLGSKMGLKVWAPKNDRSRRWNGSAIGGIARLLGELPTNFD